MMILIQKKSIFSNWIDGVHLCWQCPRQVTNLHGPGPWMTIMYSRCYPWQHPLSFRGPKLIKLGTESTKSIPCVKDLVSLIPSVVRDPIPLISFSILHEPSAQHRQPGSGNECMVFSHWQDQF